MSGGIVELISKGSLGVAMSDHQGNWLCRDLWERKLKLYGSLGVVKETKVKQIRQDVHLLSMTGVSRETYAKVLRR
jgi:hypothetical protein